MKRYIYCYVNKINHKKYVGQTNDLKRRQKQHKDAIKESRKDNHEDDYNQVIHQAFRKYGLDSFHFVILETIENGDIDLTNQQENFWINCLHTLSPSGYNLKLQGISNRKGKSELLTQEQIKQIFQQLESGEKISTVAEQYNLSKSYISSINCGRNLRDVDREYPIQKNRTAQERYSEILDLLINTTYSQHAIATYIGCSRDTISRINLGKVTGISDYYDGDFPIRKNRSGYKLGPVETIQG